jgi:hypothetical protein
MKIMLIKSKEAKKRQQQAAKEEAIPLVRKKVEVNERKLCPF